MHAGYSFLQLSTIYKYPQGSVMHYNAYSFAKDPSKPTIIVPAGKTIGQRVALSDVSIVYRPVGFLNIIIDLFLF